jgi:hypothetical protein
MEDELVEKNGREKYIKERNGRSSKNGKKSSHSAHANGRNECRVNKGYWGSLPPGV